VSAEIEGRKLTSVFEIDRSHLRENQSVWIMTEDGRLEIRPVEIAFSGPEKVFISAGLTNDEKLVVTDIAAPVQDMPLRVASAGRQAPKGPPADRKKGER